MGEHKSWEMLCQTPETPASPHSSTPRAGEGKKSCSDWGSDTAAQGWLCKGGIALLRASQMALAPWMRQSRQGKDRRNMDTKSCRPWPGEVPDKTTETLHPDKTLQSSGHQPSSFQHPHSKQGSLISGDISHLQLISLVHPASQGLSTAVGTCPRLCSLTAKEELRTVYPRYFLTSEQSSDSSPEHQGQ